MFAIKSPFRQPNHRSTPRSGARSMPVRRFAVSETEIDLEWAEYLPPQR